MSALAAHVIDTVHAWDDFLCAISCLHGTVIPLTLFKESSNVSELNHSNKIASPGDLVYYELVFK